jgi:hypothetical protein
MADKMKTIYRTAESLQHKHGRTLTPSYACQISICELSLLLTHEHSHLLTNNPCKNNDSRIGSAVKQSLMHKVGVRVKARIGEKVRGLAKRLVCSVAVKRVARLGY